MRENKFENQVREQMDQLGFDPSDKVWTQVDQAINSEKKKRRPLFWIFFLSGLIIAGGATYFVIDNPHKEIIRTEKLEQDKSNIKGKVPETKTIKPGSKSGSVLYDNSQLVIKRKSGGANNAILIASKAEVTKNDIGKKPGIINEPPPGQPGADSNTVSKMNQKGTQVEGEKIKKTLQADSVSDSKTVKTKSENKKNPWSIGFAASLGVSNINQSLFQSLHSSNLSYAANYPVNSSSGPPAAINTPSETQAGFSFAVGFSVKRNLSKRITGSAGLGYHYYSTAIHTGTPVDSALTVYSGFAQLSLVNSFYRNGEGREFTNQYHFIEFPVNLNFQLNKSPKLPVNWEAGFALAWLVSANALHFDPYTNVYFKNNQLFNKVQWNAATAILVGFPFENHSIQLGPQVQYSLSSLLKNNSTYPGHLIYFGLKCSFSR